MVMRRRKANPELAKLIVELKKAARAHQAPIWAAIAARLERPRHQVVPVNVGQLSRVAAAGETVVVPGKLLADGHLAKRLTVAAFGFSTEARGKVRAAGGTALTLHDLLKSHPDGSGVRLLA